jgi:glucokinase
VATESRRVLALDIGGTKLTAGIGHADGDITRQRMEPTRADEGAPTVLARALGLARDCLEAERADGGEVEMIGVSTMGVTRESHVELAPNVPGWDALRIPDALRTAFPERRIVIDNDVRVATRAEMRWGELRDVADGIYLNLGTGIAAGIVAGGQLLSGAHGIAGEVGYTMFDAGLEDGLLAREGVAAFEDFYGGAGAARRLAGGPLPGTVAEVVSREETDPGAREFLHGLWTGIAMLAANLCCALDPSVLVLGGGYLRGASRLRARMREIVDRAVPIPPAIVTARFGADASLRGAAAAAFAALEAT